jgi:hypothetical protein
MTEQEWLACRDPYQMASVVRDRLSERKGLLYLVAVYRRWWLAASSWLGPRAPEALQSEEDALLELERFADGAAWMDVRRPARPVLNQLKELAVASHHFELAAHIRDAAESRRTRLDLKPDVPSLLWLVTQRDAIRGWAQVPAAQRSDPSGELADLLRELIGNPFRAPAVEARWLTWNDGTVQSLAMAIYAERSFDRLAVLADALEEAGCTDAPILAHCRGPRPHVRGCWVVDVLLEME